MRNFDKVFQETLNELEAEAKALGMSFTSICRDTGVSRATPDRWRKEPPKTIEIVTRMQGLVAAKRAQIAREEADALHHD